MSDPASLSASADVASPRGIDERASASPPAVGSALIPLSRLWSEPAVDASFRSSTRRESFCSCGRCIAISERSAFSKCSLRGLYEDNDNATLVVTIKKKTGANERGIRWPMNACGISTTERLILALALSSLSCVSMSQSEPSELPAELLVMDDDDDDAEPSMQSGNVFDGHETQLSSAVSELFPLVSDPCVSELFALWHGQPLTCELHDAST